MAFGGVDTSGGAAGALQPPWGSGRASPTTSLESMLTDRDGGVASPLTGTSPTRSEGYAFSTPARASGGCKLQRPMSPVPSAAVLPPDRSAKGYAWSYLACRIGHFSPYLTAIIRILSSSAAPRQ
jgi:hypothetical protein